MKIDIIALAEKQAFNQYGEKAKISHVIENMIKIRRWMDDFPAYFKYLLEGGESKAVLNYHKRKNKK